MADTALVWFRRDLRADDHAALYHALRNNTRVWCAFCFDTEILDPLPRRDRRVEFLVHACAALARDLEALGGGLIALHGAARDRIPALARALGVSTVHANHDYEPSAIARDEAVRAALAAAGIAFRTSKDQAIFERTEILTQAGTPFSVFTPYKNAWLKRVDAFFLSSYPVARYASHLAPVPQEHRTLPSLEALGFEPTNLLALGIVPSAAGAEHAFDDFLGRIDRYDRARDFPAVKGPSYLSVHLRFGTISIRRLARAAASRAGTGAAVWLSELIWRDFYFQILANFPHVVDGAFRPEYDHVRFDDDPRLLDAWREARTGYPIVDAAMRQILETGWMHNRLRMIVASFLVKDLHVHWGHGERFFAEHLNDFDLSANNGGWQWAASSGCDAQPYFRIFNPVTQSEKFDAEGKFIRRYLPALARVPDRHIHAPWRMSPAEQEAAGCRIGRDYPAPVVDHDAARKVTLERYGVVKRPG
jgi:deoxyribodipyrimidine photo-lyase